MDRTVRHGPAYTPRPSDQSSSWHPDAREPRRAPVGVPGRAAGARLRARAAGGRAGARGRDPDPRHLPRRCSTRRCARSGTAGRWARSTSPRSTTRPRSRSRSSTGSAAGCARPPKDGRLAIVSGTPDELHALGTRMVADFLEADGWEVLLLGAGRAGATTSRRSSSPSSPTWSRSRPRRRACSTASSRCSARCARSSRGRASSPAASSGRPRRARAALEFGADLVVQDPRELVALLHERIPPLGRRNDDPRRRPAGRGRGARPVRRGGRVARRARADRPVGQRAVLGHRGARRRARPSGRPAAGCGSPSGDGSRVGAIVLGARPEHVSPAAEPERYIEALVTLTRARRPGHRRRARAPRDQGDADRGASRCCAWTAGRARRRWSPGTSARASAAAAPSTVARLARPGLLDGAALTSRRRRGGAATAGRCGSPGTSSPSRR